MFDDVEESTNISAEVHRKFFHSFLETFRSLESDYIYGARSQEEFFNHQLVYADCGLPGCCGSCDCTHIPWGRAPFENQHKFKGVKGYPTLSFEVIVTHDGRCISVSDGYPGSFNDKQIMRGDVFIQNLLDRKKYKDYE